MHRYELPDLWAKGEARPVAVLFHAKQIDPDRFRIMVEEATELVVRRDREAAELARRMRREGMRGGLPRRYATLAPFVVAAMCRQHGFRARPLEGPVIRRRAAVATA